MRDYEGFLEGLGYKERYARIYEQGEVTDFGENDEGPDEEKEGLSDDDGYDGSCEAGNSPSGDGEEDEEHTTHAEALEVDPVAMEQPPLAGMGVSGAEDDASLRWSEEDASGDDDENYSSQVIASNEERVAGDDGPMGTGAVAVEEDWASCGDKDASGEEDEEYGFYGERAGESFSLGLK